MHSHWCSTCTTKGHVSSGPWRLVGLDFPGWESWNMWWVSDANGLPSWATQSPWVIHLYIEGPIAQKSLGAHMPCLARTVVMEYATGSLLRTVFHPGPLKATGSTSQGRHPRLAHCGCSHPREQINVTLALRSTGNHVLDLSSDEETVVMAHSFCSDFQGMHLWESSSIQARVL